MDRGAVRVQGQSAGRGPGCRQRGGQAHALGEPLPLNPKTMEQCASKVRALAEALAAANAEGKRMHWVSPFP